KKTLPASEQEREDVQQARRAWRQALPTMEVEKLVFIDETWTSTRMTRRYGRAPRGRRCLDSAPHGHWETTTFVGALRRRRLTADGHRRTAGRRDVSGLCASIPVPNTTAGRHRDPRQPQQSQGGGSRGSDHRHRSNRTLSATLLS